MEKDQTEQPNTPGPMAEVLRDLLSADKCTSCGVRPKAVETRAGREGRWRHEDHLRRKAEEPLPIPTGTREDRLRISAERREVEAERYKPIAEIRKAEMAKPFRTLDICSHCKIIAQRKAEYEGDPQGILRVYIKIVGEAYIDADLDGVEIADKLLAAKDDIFLWGDVGVGKTWAMAALIKHFLCEGYNCERINLDAFCREIRATMNSQGGHTEDYLIGRLVEFDKLFIDDIGLRSKLETDFVYGVFYSIFDKRQERKLSTYLSSNKSTADLASTFDQRIESRLSTATIIEMTGTDRRKLKT